MTPKHSVFLLRLVQAQTAPIPGRWGDCRFNGKRSPVQGPIHTLLMCVSVTIMIQRLSLQAGGGERGPGFGGVGEEEMSGSSLEALSPLSPK